MLDTIFKYKFFSALISFYITETVCYHIYQY
jgi:hypothetical protein